MREYIKLDILMQLDADGQVDESIIPKLVTAIENGYTLALGSRFVTGGKNELSFSRRLFSKGSSLVCRFIMGPLDIQEFTNSARAFTPELFRYMTSGILQFLQLIHQSHNQTY